MKVRIFELIEVLRSHRPNDHDMWSGTELVCAPSRVKKLQELRKKGIVNFTPSDLDYLIFKSKSTIGSNLTFQFLLPDFFKVYFENPDYGFVCDADTVRRKMDYCNFENWPSEAQDAALELVRLAKQVEETFEYEA